MSVTSDRFVLTTTHYNSPQLTSAVAGHYARDTPWGSELGFYVLSDSQSGLAYPFAAATLRSLISSRLRKYV